MTKDVPEDFQRKIDAFNDDQGGPSRIAVCWNTARSRWCVYAVPVYDSTHPTARNSMTRKLLRPFADGSDRLGVPILIWCYRDEQQKDVGFRALDDRLFHMLRWADSFRSREHFEEAVEAPALQREAIRKATVRDAMAGAREYWWAIDRPLVPVEHSLGG